MEDLLREQQQQVASRTRLPQIKVMPAAAGMFEFADTNDTVREIIGVVLNTHPRNILWDKPYGTASDPNDEQAGKPACSSKDGMFGTPRAGFAHINLGGRVATGTERIACASCKYNEWGSKPLIPALMRPGDSGKGKAVTNQRSVYLLISGKAMPYELVLPPTSIKTFDEYLLTLLNSSVPVQAVLTRLTQERKERGSQRWAEVQFSNAGSLTQEQFSAVLEKRTTFAAAMTPALQAEDAVTTAAEPETASEEEVSEAGEIQW